MSLYLTAIIKSTPGNAEQLKALLKTLVIGSKSEAACIQYDLHQAQEDPNVLIFHEEWASRQEWDLHNATPHIKKFAADAAIILDGKPIIYITERVD
ncbi:antibiotic biosynthesis monooxygenase [Pedobacter lusitanus]|uniref:Antibiotic biosynthesis monooxygenase n=1 Tax=Pedobacter lusitanus TaxID=1503925 RepID=A0A0D0FAF8_9SPHI|nr:putative quinol monooxygenase [Pedobacter lusitanus]KIO78788.1 antibiotic biosynthesis monooxygenase [Pedobacter lusitanus]